MDQESSCRCYAAFDDECANILADSWQSALHKGKELRFGKYQAFSVENVQLFPCADWVDLTDRPVDNEMLIDFVGQVQFRANRKSSKKKLNYWQSLGHLLSICGTGSRTAAGVGCKNIVCSGLSEMKEEVTSFRSWKAQVFF